MLRSASNRFVEKPIFTVSTAQYGAQRFCFNDVTERISARREAHGLLRNGYPPLKMSQSGSVFECTMERSGSDIRLWEKSRIVTERISAATNFTERCGFDQTTP